MNKKLILITTDGIFNVDISSTRTDKYLLEPNDFNLKSVKVNRLYKILPIRTWPNAYIVTDEEHLEQSLLRWRKHWTSVIDKYNKQIILSDNILRGINNEAINKGYGQ